MRILLDHNTPAPLRYWLIGHEVETAYERGWAELSNGELLRMAQEHQFDVLIAEMLTSIPLQLAQLRIANWRLTPRGYS